MGLFVVLFLFSPPDYNFSGTLLQNRRIQIENRFFFFFQQSRFYNTIKKYIFPFLPWLSSFLAPWWKEPVGCSKPTRSPGSSTILLCPPERAELSPHGTDRVINTHHHSWENALKLPNSSQTSVLRTRDSTLTAAPTWNGQGMVWLDSSAVCCGFCAVKLLGSRVEGRSGREKGLALAHLATKVTEEWTVSCL